MYKLICGVLAIIAMISLWACGVGILVSLIAALVSSMGIIATKVSFWLPVKFIFGWIGSFVATLVFGTVATIH